MEINKLAILRTTKGFSIRALSEAAKVNSATIVRLEQGQKGSLLTIGKLATALGVDIHELMDLYEGPDVPDKPKKKNAEPPKPKPSNAANLDFQILWVLLEAKELPDDEIAIEVEKKANKTMPLGASEIRHALNTMLENGWIEKASERAVSVLGREQMQSYYRITPTGRAVVDTYLNEMENTVKRGRKLLFGFGH